MIFNKIIVSDLESNGLLDTISKIHCLGVGWRNSNDKWEVKTTTNYEDIKKLFTNRDAIIAGHNFCQYDVPAVEKVLGIKVEATILDTLALSYALFPNRPNSKHNLGDWGETFGVPKPVVEDWSDQPTEVYINRVTEDVKINVNLWIKIEKKLLELYDGDEVQAMKYCKYLSFKADCLREQEENPINVDVELCKNTIEWFEKQKEEKVELLKPIMPKVPNKVKRTKPKNCFKKNGNLSKAGERWFNLIEGCNLPEDYEGEIEEIVSYSEPNPNSSDQIKKWLFTLDWQPVIFNQGVNGEIPQVRTPERELCESVLKLAEKEPAIKELEGITVLTHRIGVLKGFLSNLRDGNKVVARATAYTNTLRLQHASPVVNLPKVITKGEEKGSIRDGKWVRGVMIAPEGYLFCGSDMSSLEDRMKQHYIYDYDPEYVHEMMTPDFDPHLDLAVAAGALTQEQANAHKRGEEDFGKIRHTYKTGNYSLQYGVGVPKLAKSAGITQKEAKKVKEQYWKRNWAVKKAADDFKVKTVDSEMWMLNPINNFYYNLRSEKDRMSLACQGGGTYVFDMWIYFIRSKNIKIRLQYHDEKGSFVKNNSKEVENHKNILKWAVSRVNEVLKLKREMDVDVQFGRSYADVH